MKILIKLIIIILIAVSCKGKPSSDSKDVESDTSKFPVELTEFTTWRNNPVFTGTSSDTWDQKIRERGYILHGWRKVRWIYVTPMENLLSKELSKPLQYFTRMGSGISFMSGKILGSGWLSQMI